MEPNLGCAGSNLIMMFYNVFCAFFFNNLSCTANDARNTQVKGVSEYLLATTLGDIHKLYNTIRGRGYTLVLHYAQFGIKEGGGGKILAKMEHSVKTLEGSRGRM